jgi:monoamine oxidase
VGARSTRGCSPLASWIATTIDVLILEAQDRAGGRTLTVRLDESAFIDDGGPWVSPNR